MQFVSLETSTLSEAFFEIAEVNTYQFGERWRATLTLNGEAGVVLYMSIREEEPKPLVIGGRIKSSDVGRLFDVKQFARLFEEKEGPLTLQRREEPPSLAGWTAPIYGLRIDGEKGVYHKGDFRGNAFVPMPADGEGLDYYLLADETADRSLEVEVYDGGVTEVFVSLNLPLTAISRMWPG